MKNLKSALRCCFSVVLGLLCIHSALAQDVVLTVRPVSATDTRYEYPEMILKKVIAVTTAEFGAASVQHAASSMSRHRLLRELREGNEIHVMAEAPKSDWVNALKTVYIPIRKGVQGYRVFLIDQQYQPELSRIASLDELKRVKTGAGTQWSTAKVLKENGFNLITGMKFDGLFWMLMGGRFKTFGRGINEAPVELAARRNLFPDMVIEKDLALYLPLPTFFFVSPNKPKLARRIERGLNMLIDSGEFDKIFYDYHLEMIKAANLDSRKIFPVKNHTLPNKIPFDVEHFWYKPGDEKKSLGESDLSLSS